LLDTHLLAGPGRIDLIHRLLPRVNGDIQVQRPNIREWFVDVIVQKCVIDTNPTASPKEVQPKGRAKKMTFPASSVGHLNPDASLDGSVLFHHNSIRFPRQKRSTIGILNNNRWGSAPDGRVRPIGL